LPLFDSASSVAVVVTAPSKADQICEGLQQAGFVVDRRMLDIGPGEIEDGLEGSESEGDSEPSISDSEFRQE